jgi:hypothetical protein
MFTVLFSEVNFTSSWLLLTNLLRGLFSFIDLQLAS